MIEITNKEIADHIKRLHQAADHMIAEKDRQIEVLTLKAKLADDLEATARELEQRIKQLERQCNDSDTELVAALERIAELTEQVRRLMEVSQHCLSERKYLAEVGLYQ